MTPAPSGWRCTWVWSAGRMSPGSRKPAWQSFPTKAAAQVKATELRALAARLDAVVAVSITQELPA